MSVGGKPRNLEDLHAKSSLFAERNLISGKDRFLSRARQLDGNLYKDFQTKAKSGHKIKCKLWLQSSTRYNAVF